MRNRPSPGHDLEAKAIGARIEAQNMLPDPKRTEALLKEAKLRNPVRKLWNCCMLPMPNTGHS